jgi:trk system potassium uptake protein TrkH
MLHSKIMLAGTATLLSLGTVLVLALEWNGVLAELPLLGKVVAAMFHSTTCRTVGFNTIPVGQLSSATLFLSILLMMIGAGPCSTGGGFKVSTLSVLVLRAWSTFRGGRKVVVARRTIPQRSVDRATTSALLFVVVGALALTVLLVTEQDSAAMQASRRAFIEVAFEVVSALGTVGLSTGLTPSLTALGKMVIIVLMFTGRLGPFSVFAVLSRPEREAAIEYAQEEPLIG